MARIITFNEYMKMSIEERDKFNVCNSPNECQNSNDVIIDFEGMTATDIIEKYEGISWEEFDTKMKKNMLEPNQTNTARNI